MAGGLPDINGFASLPLIRAGSKGEGQPKPIMANAIMILKAAREFFNLRFDEFSQCPFRGAAKLTDADFLDITNWMQVHGIHADVRIVTNAVIHVANNCRFHQVRDYLDALVWDGEPRLDTVFIKYGGADDTSLARAWSAKWHIQAVARIYEPGCKADHMLILEGEQGLRKSGYFDTMGHPWFIDSISDLGSKDARQEIRGIWIVEMAEMNNLHRSEASQIKSFMTTRSDHYRDSYGRVTQDYPRQCVLAGTINPGANGYLKDPTGARRFWPISITRQIDLGIIRDIKDQLWAEAVARYRDDEPWHLTDKALLDAAEESQAERYEIDPWSQVVADFIKEQSGVTIEDILANALFLVKGDWGKAQEMRIGNILTHFKWKRKRSGVGYKRKYRYYPTVDDAQPELIL